MGSDVKVLSRTRVSHEKGRLNNMQMPITVTKVGDGKFKAYVTGQETAFSAEGTSEGDALYNVKQVIKDKMLSGNFAGVDQRVL